MMVPIAAELEFLLQGSSWYQCLYDVLVKRGWHLTLHSHRGDEWGIRDQGSGARG
jgi:hypothetical protein